MKCQVWFNLVLVIEDKDREIDLKKINRLFNSYLLGKKEISWLESKLLKRITRKGEVVIADALSSLDVPRMMSILNQHYSLESSDEDLIKKYPYFRLPKRSLVTGECHGGAFRHTFSIDPGVRPLVEAINKIPHVRSFSSCDGHGERCLYVCYRVFRSRQAPRVLKILEDAFNEVYPRYGFPLTPFKVQYMVGYTDFMFNKMDLYFSVRIVYAAYQKEEIFEFVKEVSDVIVRKVR